MFGKILRFARPLGVQPVSTVAATQDTLDTQFGHPDSQQDTLLRQEDTQKNRVSRVSLTAAAREFLDIAMAEIWQLYTLASREPIEEIKLATLVDRYQQLRDTHPWPYQTKSQLAQSLVACGCKSYRKNHKGGKMPMIVFPAYPEAQLPGKSNNRK